jgi:alkylated DNA repair dioxygenase AlkB
VSSDAEVVWQPGLFGRDKPSIDPSLAGLQHIDLDGAAWVDYLPGWLAGSDVLFDDLVSSMDWQELDRVMYGQVVRQPRLTARWAGEPDIPVLGQMAGALSRCYNITFDSLGLNLYRDGRDSVAWHGDRIPKSIIDPIVALVSAGHPRRFLLRPKGGGRSRAFDLGRGDLLVTGGTCQRTWQHSVPKVAGAGPRISLAYRHSANRDEQPARPTDDKDGSRWATNPGWASGSSAYRD